MGLIDLTVKEFLEVTASKEPVPGGGSVSAQCGAIAASLAKMVAGLTIGRKKYADVEPEMVAHAAHFEEVSARLLALIDEDANAYNLVMDAYKLPKDTDEEKAARSEAIQRALKVAAEVPMRVAEIAAAQMPLIADIARKGNQNAVTDACVAMMNARTATLGAILNVKINLSSIDDADYVAAMTAKSDKLWRKAVDSEEQLLRSISL